MELLRSIQPTLDTLQRLGFVVSAGTHDVFIQQARMKWPVLVVIVAPKDYAKSHARVPKRMVAPLG